MENKLLLYFQNRLEWRKWLEINYNKCTEVWLIYYKKHTLKPRIPYDDAVEEALCFGWIDSTVKRIDEEKFSQKFTPRREKSVWSDLNKARVEKLIRDGSMREPGLTKINKAKCSGHWDKVYPERNIPEDCPELSSALEDDPEAKENFDKLPPSQKKIYKTWIASAKKNETKKRRVEESLSLLRKDKKLGMK